MFGVDAGVDDVRAYTVTITIVVHVLRAAFLPMADTSKTPRGIVLGNGFDGMGNAVLLDVRDLRGGD